MGLDIETIVLIAALNSIRKLSLLASFPVTWPKTVYHVFFSMYVVANRESKALLTLILKYESAGE